MGKVKEDAPSKAAKAASKGSAMKDARRRLAPFVANLARVELYKPTQGVYARSWTAAGLGILAAIGVYRLYEVLLSNSLGTRVGVVTAVSLALAWLLYRVLCFPPFADFLVATEAEMNKVSWTSKDDLYRATMVVLTTVALMSIFLFGVDYVWSTLLKALRVLEFDVGTPDS